MNIEQKVISLYKNTVPYRIIAAQLSISQNRISQILIKYNIPHHKQQARQRFEAGFKTCTICKTEKPILDFSKNRCSSLGIRSYCLFCEQQKKKQHRLENLPLYLERERKQREQNPGRASKYWHENKNHLSAIRKAKRQNDPLFRAQEDNYAKQYRLNPAKHNIITAQKQRYYHKYRQDPVCRALWNARNRLRKFLTRQCRNESSLSLIGCDIVTFKTHLEQQFVLGMNWNNYGKWHIDHKIPCASFDLSKPEEQKKCFHFTNLQPLWARDNLVKGCK